MKTNLFIITLFIAGGVAAQTSTVSTQQAVKSNADVSTKQQSATVEANSQTTVHTDAAAKAKQKAVAAENNIKAEANAGQQKADNAARATTAEVNQGVIATNKIATSVKTTNDVNVNAGSNTQAGATVQGNATVNTKPALQQAGQVKSKTMAATDATVASSQQAAVRTGKNVKQTVSVTGEGVANTSTNMQARTNAVVKPAKVKTNMNSSINTRPVKAQIAGATKIGLK